MANSLQKPANISLSPRQVSYLVQKNKPEYQRYGFKFQQIHFESNGKTGLIKSSFEGPLGIWVKVEWTGAVQLSQDKKWIVKTDKLWAGNIPIHLVFPQEWTPNWPTEFRNGRIRLLRVELDGRGLRARLTHRGLNLQIPGIDAGKSLIEKGVESLKNLF